MRTVSCARLLGIVLSGMLAFAPMPLLATVYKCKNDGQTTYSNSPCDGKMQEVKVPLSVTPAYQPPAPLPDSTRNGGLLDKLGLDGKDLVTMLLFVLVPLSFMVMFFMSRKSQNAAR